MMRPSVVFPQGGSKEPPSQPGVGFQMAVKKVVTTFLETRHYRDLHRLLSDEWSNCHSLTAAIRLIEQHGVFISPEEEKRLAALPEERMIDALVMRMPQQSREQFEHFFLQLSLIASTTSRLRTAIEQGRAEETRDVLESAEDVGILSYILKMGVAQAGQEVKRRDIQYDNWAKDTEGKLGSMLQAQQAGVAAAKALADAKERLGETRMAAGEKSRKVLMSLVGGQTEALKSVCLIGWADTVKKIKRENEIAKEYEEQLSEAMEKLAAYKAKQMAGVTGVLNRKFADASMSLLAQCFQAFLEVCWDTQRGQSMSKSIKEVEARMDALSGNQKDNAKAVLARMNLASSEALVQMCMSTWIQFSQEYKKDKEMNDAVKAAEQRVNEFLANANDGAKSVLNRMSAGSDTALMTTAFQGWVDVWQSEKEDADMQEQMNAKAGRMGQFAQRNKGTAMGEMDRARVCADETLSVIVFVMWKRETRVERMKWYGKYKNNRRTEQLKGVKNLFSNFATELEQGLKAGTPRIDDTKVPRRKERPPRPEVQA